MKRKIVRLFAVLAAGILLGIYVCANNLPFVPFDPVRTGDANCDGVVDAEDSTHLSRYFAGYPVSIDETFSDVDGDGTVTRKDAMILTRYTAGWEGYTLPYTE